jgi:hypothetical protein
VQATTTFKAAEATTWCVLAGERMMSWLGVDAIVSSVATASMSLRVARAMIGCLARSEPISSPGTVALTCCSAVEVSIAAAADVVSTRADPLRSP